MKNIALTNEQMRLADEYTIGVSGVNSEQLMARAGQWIAEEVEKAAKERNFRKILVICGLGNNGGDGYVAARELQKRGFDVEIYAFEGNLSDDCRREKFLTKCRYFWHTTGAIDFSEYEIIVDCIFGTGLKRDVSGEFARVIEAINNSKAFVVSADIPSGLDGDSGLIRGVAVKADLTVAIAAKKVGEVLSDGLDCCGKITVRDIGVTFPEKNYTIILDGDYISPRFPARLRNTHKGSYGTATIVAGSAKYAGAAALAAEGALKSGCGYVKLCCDGYVKSLLLPRYPQTIFCDEVDLNSNAVAIGMGMGADESTYEKVCRLLREYSGTLIIDADGLNSLAKFGLEPLKNKKCRVAITPHAKEFARLTGLTVGEVLKDPVNLARNFAREYGVTVLLKGAASIICDGENTVINTRGTTALSKGGSGDVLSGFACGTAARGLSAFDAVACSAYVLGVASELASAEMTDYCATARDILKNLHNSVKNIINA